MSLRSKIISIFTLLIIIPTLFLGFNNYRTANQTLVNELNRSSKQVVHRVGDSIDLFMESMEQLVEATSNNGDIQNFYHDPDNFQDSMIGAFKNVVDAYDCVLNIYLGAPDKSMYIYPHHEFDADFDPSQRLWYIGAMEDDSVIWTEPYVDAVTGELVISSAKAVYEPTSGDLIGVVSFDISLATINTLVENSRIGQEGFIVVTDEEAVIMMHQESDLIGDTVPIAELLEALLSEESASIDYYRDGDKLLGVFYTLDKMGWKVIGVVPYGEISSNARFILRNILINGSMVLLITIFIAYIFSGFMVKHLRVLVQDVERIGQGDFSIRSNILSRDEIGQLSTTLNNMVEGLGNLIRNVQGASQEVHRASQALTSAAQDTNSSTSEVGKAVEEIARGASDQASEAQRSSIITNDLAQKVTTLKANSEDMLQASEAVSTANIEGLSVIEDLKSKNIKSNESIEEIELAIQQLDAKSQSIGGILETISAIAEQTNLLALNAAIEAARAGDAGMGFAVVAEEIRKLAEQSSNSTEEIKDIISSIQEESNHTVGIMSQVISLNEERDLTVQEVGGSFETTSKTIDIIIGKINNINEYVLEMAEDMRGIVETIESISSVSQETAAASQEVTASMEQTVSAVDAIFRGAEDLNRLAESLGQEVDKFRI